MKTPVYIFESGERTKDLSVFCFQKLGYENVNLISDGKTFKEKYIIFAKAALQTDSKHFIRSDSDCLAFHGVNRLLEKAVDEEYDWLTGVYFDYVMNRFRGGTPQILSRKTLELLVENNDLMPESKKPETDFSISIKEKVKMGDVNIFTNLHEFEQFPSKVCNSFLNRLARGHSHLYNQDHLSRLPYVYRRSIDIALENFQHQRQKSDMTYSDFGFLNENVEPISQNDYEIIHAHYSELFQMLLQSYSGE